MAGGKRETRCLSVAYGLKGIGKGREDKRERRREGAKEGGMHGWREEGWK